MRNGSAVGCTTLLLWCTLKTGDVLYLADDDQEAEGLATALRKIAPECNVIYVPSSDTLPGERIPASPANVGVRVTALSSLRRIQQQVDRPNLATILSGEAAARLYAKPSAFDAAPPILKAGDTIDKDRFFEDMLSIGYVADDRIDEPGEIAVRGEVVDIFPVDAGFPVRIEVLDGRVVAMRYYDPVSQLSTGECAELAIGRALEPPIDGRTSILAHLRSGVLIKSAKADDRRRRFIRLAGEAAQGSDLPDAISEEEWAAGLTRWHCNPDLPDMKDIPRFAEQRSPLAAMERFCRPLLESGHRLVLTGSERDTRFLRPKIEKSLQITLVDLEALEGALDLRAGQAGKIIAPLERGVIWENLIMVAAADLLGSRAVVGETTDTTATALVASGDIRAGDIVVHEDHGVGRAVGLVKADKEGESESIILEYAGGTRRLIPTSSAGRLWRYGADADGVALDRLDGASWQRRRSSIDEAVLEGARALLSLAEERARLKAPILEPEASLYEQFAATFPFNETADQARAIQSVRDDLASGRPMDRLVIGDVGFGKTEVALRAAALAGVAGFQTIVAAPTTVLVRQHFQTFQRRFARFGLRVGILSRLATAAERKAVKADFAAGTITILIGTAAVLAKDVNAAQLGLVIIDEEQRFGAADKAKLRGRPDVHLLTMSATPIPRTLHRAMIGLQQISEIATPPSRRQPIRTTLDAPDDARIRTALLREYSRGGQSFVVAPRIEDLSPVAERLRRLVPNLALVIAHGKMPAAKLDQAMVDFGDGQGDVLLATNIIEAGLDVPRANTMIVWNADRFGLAQLHQLRGRVGRGNRRGQVMLMTEAKSIAERTLKRLRTLATHDRLGAGFEISAADLDQRGAGDPLSDVQAGHMKLIGLELYQHLFNAALERARGRDGDLWIPEINLNMDSVLPESWIPDADLRLGLYVRLARVTDEDALDALEAELADRFGPLPEPARVSVELARVSLRARMANIMRVDAGPAAIALTPRKGQSVPKHLGLEEKDGRWLLKKRSEASDRLSLTLDLLEAVAEPEHADA